MRKIPMLLVIVVLTGLAAGMNEAGGQSDDIKIQSIPKPVEATTVKSSKSNSSERQIQPTPKPVEATTVKSSKSNSSE